MYGVLMEFSWAPYQDLGCTAAEMIICIILVVVVEGNCGIFGSVVCKHTDNHIFVKLVVRYFVHLFDNFDFFSNFVENLIFLELFGFFFLHFLLLEQPDIQPSHIDFPAFELCIFLLPRLLLIFFLHLFWWQLFLLLVHSFLDSAKGMDFLVVDKVALPLVLYILYFLLLLSNEFFRQSQVLICFFGHLL